MTPRTIEPNEIQIILDNFLPLAVNGEIDPKVKDIISSCIKDIAAGHEAHIQKGPLLDIVKTFFACFDFDDEEGTYRFQRDSYITTGETGPGLIHI